MKPEQFIREYGVVKAREVVEGAPLGSVNFSYEDDEIVCFKDDVYFDNDYEDWFEIYFMMPELISLSELKRLLESIDQINAFDGGIKEAKEILSRINKNGSKYATLFERPALEQAIRDHESIYGGGDE